jgi:hypothetical protein
MRLINSSHVQLFVCIVEWKFFTRVLLEDLQMKKFLVLIAASLVAATAFASDDTDKCIANAERNGCRISGNNKDRIAQNVSECRALTVQGLGSQQLFLLRNTGKVVAINLNDFAGKAKTGTNNCAMKKFDFGTRIVKTRNSGPFNYLIGADKTAYLMDSLGQAFQLANSKGKPYSTIVDVKSDGQGGVELIQEASNPIPLDVASIIEKAKRGQVRIINATDENDPQRSPFRDE